MFTLLGVTVKCSVAADWVRAPWLCAAAGPAAAMARLAIPRIGTVTNAQIERLLNDQRRCMHSPLFWCASAQPNPRQDITPSMRALARASRAQPRDFRRRPRVREGACPRATAARGDRRACRLGNGGRLQRGAGHGRAAPGVALASGGPPVVCRGCALWRAGAAEPEFNRAAVAAGGHRILFSPPRSRADCRAGALLFGLWPGNWVQASAGEAGGEQ